MAEPIIKVKRSSVPGKIPTTTQIESGELAINTYDGKIFLLKFLCIIILSLLSIVLLQNLSYV